MTEITRPARALCDNACMTKYAIKLLCAFCLLAGSAFAQAAIVNVGGSFPPSFAPQTITIHVGDTVTFVNKGGLHNVAADNGSFRCAHGCDGDGHGGNGNATSSSWVANVTFTRAGTVGYFCETHGAPGTGMFGTIIVQAVTPVRLQSFEVD